MISRETLNDYYKRANDGDGAFAIAYSLGCLAMAVDRLGFGNEKTMGPIEKLAVETGSIHEALTAIAEAIESAGSGEEVTS